MAWITENGFWILVAIAFISMHMFGHGGHGGHGGHSGSDRQEKRGENNEDISQGRRVKPESRGHQH